MRGASAFITLSGQEDAGPFHTATSVATPLKCRGLFLRRQAAITLHADAGAFGALNPTGPLCVGVVRENGARDAEPRAHPPGRLHEACQALPAFEKLSALNTDKCPCLSAFHEARQPFANMVHKLVVG